MVRPALDIYTLSTLLNHLAVGLVVVEGSDHARQRKIMVRVTDYLHSYFGFPFQTSV